MFSFPNNRHPLNCEETKPYVNYVNEIPLQNGQIQTIEPLLHDTLYQPGDQGFELKNQPVHVPNIPIKNQFSCLANIPKELNNNTTMQLNNNTKDDMFEDKKKVEYLVVNTRRLKHVTKSLNKELGRVK